MDVFGIDPESAGLVYSSRGTDGHPFRSVVGLFEDDVLQTAAIVSVGESISTVWAGGTRPGGRRRGHGLRILQEASATAYAEVGEGSLCFLASEAGDSMYDSAGAEIVEYWQMWSRPRWLLGK
ncbi:hypothetical protein QM716_01570 [Rhodococcus sp. IEGM 1409]|uniref:hypothetical protein n=1 Tax=Rhodococcus sp. IEGM 1409 TaxID=3047082 RepID=UPI0024B71E53|nr:hypothetical protein [Rhodococcus sp. IEGM 1409]MDI9898537.1 hypothetical protein [Rhodococcus sp. IEGM 1409]